MSQNCKIGIGITAFGLLILVLSKSLPSAVLSTNVGPDFFPKVWGSLLCLLGALLFVTSFFFPSEEDRQQQAAPPKQRPGTRKVALIFGMTFVYFTAMYWIGFVISSILYVASCILVIGKRDRKTLCFAVVIATLFVLGLHAFFYYGLGTFLPPPAWS